MVTLRIGLAQLNPTLGDFSGNVAKIEAWIDEASKQGADILVFPELALPGYPPQDLLLRDDFIDDNTAALEKIVQCTKGRDPLVALGFVHATEEGTYNAAALVQDGELHDIYHKVFLPNYGVFDEKRYFRKGSRISVYAFRKNLLGVNICEDIWHVEGPLQDQCARGGANVILNLSASPYHMGKGEERTEMLSSRASENDVHLVYVNCVGGQDELVFDGGSMIMGPDGGQLARAPYFEETLAFVDIEPAPPRKEWAGKTDETGGEDAPYGTRQLIELDSSIPREKSEKKSLLAPTPASREDEVWRALTLGTRDYVRKNGFSKGIVGLSGGIDSAVVAVVAADALGPENVLCLFMPSRYSSEESRRDAHELAENMGISIRDVSIDEIFGGYLTRLAPAFKGTESGIAEENMQARIRGNLLMAFSNKFGHLVLTTGNKSEMSVGYATLYGDMCGAFAVIKDVFKTMVYRLAEYRNSLGRAIPKNIITRAPTAELKPDQVDQDTLPPYDMLDGILELYVEDDMSPGEITDAGFDAEIVSAVIGMVDRSEYKRRQAPPGIKITERAFGRDRRMPITNRFRIR